jgi:hypothetical protein
MWWRRALLVGVSLVAGACSSGGQPSDLPMLTGKIIWATAMHPEDCTPAKCQATYELEIHNDSGADAAVASCDLTRVGGDLAHIPVSNSVPIVVKSGATQLVRVSSLLPLSPRRLRHLRGEHIRCADVGPDQ